MRVGGEKKGYHNGHPSGYIAILAVRNMMACLPRLGAQRASTVEGTKLDGQPITCE